MSLINDSGVCSPWLSSGSDCGDVDTPLTEPSLLFNEGDVENVIHRSHQHILVVGGLGFIGSHTCWELAKAGYNVIIIDNLSNAFNSVYKRLEAMVADHYQKASGRRPSLNFFKADYRDKKAMTAVLEAYESPPGFALDSIDSPILRRSKITGVIHFAAHKAVGESIKQPLKYYANNVSGLIDFCSLLGDFGIKNFVFSSSATVYGTMADIQVPLREEYCSQDRTVFVDDDGKQKVQQSGCSGLTNPYGRTKWMCEAILNDLAHADPEWKITALRYFNPIGCDESGLLGEDPRDAATNLIPIVLRVITGVQPTLNIYGDDYDTKDGTAVRDYIHVTDLARGHLAALKSRTEKGFKVYNLGTGTGHSVLEVVAAMERVANVKIPTQLVGRRAGDVGMCVAKPSRAQEELGWRTEKSLETCCRDVWRFLELDRVEKEEAIAKESFAKQALVTLSSVEEVLATEPTMKGVSITVASVEEPLTTEPLATETLATAALATMSLAVETVAKEVIVANELLTKEASAEGVLAVV